MSSAQSMTFAEAVRDGLAEALAADEGVLCYGLGVTDPKGVFGTTLELEERFGKERVFDMPTSENAMTGIAIGAALDGMRPIMCHQRLDFFLLALDQLVNNAAKWHYMFGEQASIPLTIRLIVGRGWGQGPSHSQNLQAWFAHVPGLKVLAPSTPSDAKGLLLSAVFDDNPVIFLEHRWLHNVRGEVPAGDFRVPIGKACRLREGDDVTIVSFSHMTVEALHAVPTLEAHGISCDVIDLRSLRPVDYGAVFESVERTGRLLALDTGYGEVSMAGEIVARVSMERFGSLKTAPRRLALPPVPTPTSPALTRVFYPRAEDIVREVGKLAGIPIATEEIASQREHPHDVPGDWFTGPF